MGSTRLGVLGADSAVRPLGHEAPDEGVGGRVLGPLQPLGGARPGRLSGVAGLIPLAIALLAATVAFKRSAKGLYSLPLTTLTERRATLLVGSRSRETDLTALATFADIRPAERARSWFSRKSLRAFDISTIVSLGFASPTEGKALVSAGG